MKLFLSNKKQKKHRAQAMVEFMLALPLLLLLIYGTIEVGRLIFIFASVANASRQAARYGSAAGEVDDIAYYQNCEAIREVANQSAYITTFDEINITYDRGVEADGTQIPITDVDPNPDVNTCPIDNDKIRNGDRIIVQISAQYEPIISIVPIDPLTIVSASARTFLISIPILGSSVPTGFAMESSTPSKTALPTSITEPATPTIGALTLTATNFVPVGGTPSNITPTDFPPYGSTPSTSSSGTPSNNGTLIPALSFTPSQTPTQTTTPSITPTPISCAGLTGVSHEGLIFKNNIMQMTITNNSGYTLSTAQIYVEWNHDRGHTSGNDSGLRLRQIQFATQTWDGDLQVPSSYIQGFYPLVPPGTSTIQFIFHQDYDLPDGTERIIINFATPGCTNYPVDSRN
jgi:Flp pilus assembly protein TadG